MNKSNNNDTVPKRFERNVGNRLVGGRVQHVIITVLGSVRLERPRKEGQSEEGLTCGLLIRLLLVIKNRLPHFS